jgi:hypothetical protein
MKNKFLAVLAFTTIMVVMSMSDLFGQDIVGGELSPDISWRIENNTLYISGEGVVPSTMFGARSAWHSHRSLFNSVVIEDGITDLGQSLFVGYKNITSLTIAGSVKDFAVNAFNSCKNLSVVEVKGSTPPDISLSVFYKVKYKNAKLIVPVGTKEIYASDPLWSQFVKIEESGQPATDQPAPIGTLSEPGTIYLKRTSNFVGGGVNVQVFLNGVEQQKLGNAKTNVMQTDRDKNELYIQQGKRRIAMRRFDATAGGDVHIEFSYFNGYMKIMEENDTE